jgi:membrane protease YdiL (CAAX protease family)
MRKLAGAALIFALVYGLSLYELSLGGGEPEEALAVLVVFGGIFGGLSWALTRKAAPFPLDLPRPWPQLAVILLLAILLIVWLCFGVDAVDAALPGIAGDPRSKSLLRLGEKLILFVALPWVVFRRLFGLTAADVGLSFGKLREFRGSAGLAALVLVPVIMGFNLLMGSAAAPIRNGEIGPATLLVALPACLIWDAIEAGLVEEFFFRALLQTRLAGVFRSHAMGTVAMAILFGLFHAPGLVLRGASAFEGMDTAPGPLFAMAYSVAIMGVAGIPFGILWARSRNLWLCLLIHGANDTIAHLPSFVKMWGG